MRGPEDYTPGLRLGRRTLVSDVDGTLLDEGSPGVGAEALGERLLASDAALVLSSGRDLSLAREAAGILTGAGLPRPSGLVCGVGTEVYVWEEGGYVADDAWAGTLKGSGFDADGVHEALAGVAGLTLQPLRAQAEHKVSYFVEEPQGSARTVASAAAALEAAGLGANLIYSASRYLDAIPPNASKGGALLHLVGRYELGPGSVVVAGDSGNDRELLLTAADAGMVAVLVANFEPEMADMLDVEGIHVASGSHCLGVLEGLERAGW